MVDWLDVLQRIAIGTAMVLSILQLRQHATQLRAETYGSIVGQCQDLLALVLRWPEAVQGIHEPFSLEGIFWPRSVHAAPYMNFYDALHAQYRRCHLIDKETWASWATFLRERMEYPSYRTRRLARRKNFLEGFRRFEDSLIADLPKLAPRAILRLIRP